MNGVKQDTYISKVKEILETRGHITSWDAIVEMGNTRISATIHELRHKYGMNIMMEMRKSENGKRYGYYYLTPSEN